MNNHPFDRHNWREAGLQWLRSIDRGVFAALIGLAILGVIMVGTASPSVAVRIGADAYHFLYNHILFLIVALTCMVAASALTAAQVWRAATVLFALAWVGVAATLYAGTEIKGATRWLYLFGFSVQPSELLKPAFVIVAAYCLARQRQAPDFPGIIIALGLFALSACVLLMQPDFGMTFLIAAVFAAQIFLAGCPLRYVALLGLTGIAGVGMAYLTLDHVQSRIDRFIFPQSGDSFQIDRSLDAFMSGGLLGAGPGQGTVRTQLPDVHSDFIFSAVGEEWGFVFTAALVGLYAWIFMRFLTRFSRTDSLFVMLAGGGLVLLLAMQCLIHMGSALRLLPAKGMTLPFISYGGSSLLSAALTFGFALALSRGIHHRQKGRNWRILVKKDL